MAAAPHAPTETAQTLDAASAHGANATAHGAAAGGHEVAATFPPFDPSLFSSQLVWFGLTFVALYLVLSRFVLPKIGAVLEKRTGAIQSDLDQAAQKSAAADTARASMERAIAKARADARTMIEAARAEMQATLNAEQEAADARLAARIGAAEAKIDAARVKALGEVPRIAEALAHDIADRLTPAPAPASRQRLAANGDV